jgi:asparagine synthase (glutamine-hydrolysing)
MCGVAGILHWAEGKDDKVELVTRMLTMIKHRGPDESGIYSDAKVCMGNVRLSIIDLASGQQPMSDDTGNLWIVFNGEIFNYIELGDHLKSKGYSFQTTCDTEVLLYLYKEYGESCLQMLNGQFAFAIWDRQNEELFMARDRVGIRPLFYAEGSYGFIFASEIKALIEHKKVNPQIDINALLQTFTFWGPLPGKTVFKNIYELEPGHYMRISARGLEKKCFWELKFSDTNKYLTTNFEEAKEGFRALFADAVKLRLRSDVPVAAYLSGGLDSSVTTSFIKDISPNHLQTFSIGFSDKDFDETSYQQEVSKYLQTRHTSFVCTPKDIAGVFPEVVWHAELPLIRTAPAPMFLLSKKVQEQNIKVVITGEGADEVLAGYDIFKEAKIRYFWAKDPNSKLRPLLLKRLYPYIPQIQNLNAQKLKFVFGYKLDDVTNPFYAHLLRWNNGVNVRRFLTAEAQNEIKDYSPMDEFSTMLPSDFSGWDKLSQEQWIECKLLMSNYILSSQGDRMAMGNSIEGRYPFLDYRIIEYAAQLPPDFKLKGLTEKYLLKRMMNGKLPSSVVNRNKQAYRAPIISAFFGNNAPAYVKEYLSEEKLKEFGIFDHRVVTNLVSKFNTTNLYSESDTMAITAILSTQLLYAMFVSDKYKPEAYMQPLAPRIVRL